MTMQELYTAVGGDYRDAAERMMGEEMLRRFLQKFLDDPSFGALEQGMAAGVQEDAFRAAHTLKGLCLNLGFGALYTSSVALTEALRHEMSPQAPELFETVCRDYAVVTASIRALS